MIKHPFGMEFNIGGSEIPEGKAAGSSDVYYASLVARLLRACEVEGDSLDPIEADNRPIIDFRDELESSSNVSPGSPGIALIPDHAIPAVLGMCRIALFNQDAEYMTGASSSYSDLPRGGLRALENSLQDYENQRLDHASLGS